MRILDFGPNSGHPITAFDSKATLTPLMRPTDAARTVVVHLPSGGLIGAHQAAEWAEGERHTSGTDAGMVAVVVEGDFEMEIPQR